ncbi:MAG: ribokinase [Dehalococcoidia bacterium]
MTRPPKLVVLGSCTVDLVLQMPRLPLAGETLFADRSGIFPGGKGLNAAVAASRLGATSAVIGRVGDDALGALLRETLRAEGVNDADVTVDTRTPSGVAVPVVLPGGGNSILAAPGANLTLGVDQAEASRGLIAEADVLVAQFETPMTAVVVAAAIARAAGTRFLLNPAPAQPLPPELWPLVDVLVVNEVEAAMLAPSARDPLGQAMALAANGPRLVAVTLGPDGVVWAGDDGNGASAALPVTAVDTVGAGDAFCAALAVGLAEGRATADAVRFASVVAGLSVTKVGAAPSYPSRREVHDALAAWTP